MLKNKWWVTVLVGVLILVVLAGAGYAVYRLGYAQGAQAGADGQSALRNYQELPNLRHFVPGSRGFERGILPYSRVGGVPGMTWSGIVMRIAIPILVVIALVLLIVFLFGKLGSGRPPQKAPIVVQSGSGDQEHPDEN